jgi:hypothetical protein
MAIYGDGKHNENMEYTPNTNETELYFFKDGDYDTQGGFFVRSDLKVFINKLIEAGHEPVGIKVDLDSFNLEVLVAAK